MKAEHFKHAMSLIIGLLVALCYHSIRYSFDDGILALISCALTLLSVIVALGMKHTNLLQFQVRKYQQSKAYREHLINFMPTFVFGLIPGLYIAQKISQKGIVADPITKMFLVVICSILGGISMFFIWVKLPKKTKYKKN